MDRHDLAGATAVDLAAAHAKDVSVQDGFGVEYVHYWFDNERQHAFCLAKGPDSDAVSEVHRASHGLMASRISEVDEDIVAGFMGKINARPVGEPYVDSAFRTVLFTDIAGSTSLTQQLGDAAVMGLVRRHDEIVRGALAQHGGTEVKHTGDGIMASFRSSVDAVQAAVEMQRNLISSKAATEDALAVRIGMAAGEPLSEGGDLFGAVVQLAARLCSKAQPRGILVSSATRDLVHGKGFHFGPQKAMRLKGFDEPMRASEVTWQLPLEG